MSHWCRLWDDMPNDPKWRVVAKRAGRPVSEVLAVFVHMMTHAASAEERGTLENWNDEDVAIAIDAESDNVRAIREAMQGKTLDENHLTGWERRQPAREDNSTPRVRAFREQRNAAKRDETHAKRDETPDKSRIDTDKKEEDSVLSDGQPEAAVPTDNVIHLPEKEDPEKSLFRRGKEILGKSAGGQIVKLLKAASGDIGEARRAIEIASGKENPAEFIAGVIRRATGPPRMKAPDTYQAAVDELQGKLRERSH